MSVTDIWGEEPVSVTDTSSSPKMEHAQTCPSDVVAVMTQSFMTQQPASTPDVSIVVMTKSSSKVLGRFPTIKYITGRWLSYRKANSKKVRIFARQKFPGFERGSGYSSSSKLLGRFPTIKSITDSATEKRIAKESGFTLDKSSPDMNGAQVTRFSIKNTTLSHNNKFYLIMDGIKLRKIDYWL